VKAGQIGRCDFNDLSLIVHRIGKGNRLRLMIAPVSSMFAEKTATRAAW